MKTPHILDKKYRLYSLYVMPVIIPLAIWGGWETISQLNNWALKVLFVAAICVGSWVSGVALFWWNAFMQKRWKDKLASR